MAGLLARLKFFRHERRWWRKHATRFGQADIVVIAHTKSGATWLRALLSHLLHLKYGVPADELLRFDNFSRLHPDIPTLQIFRDTVFPGGSHGAWDVPIAPHQKAVFLVRDPRDVAVSFYFHVRNRASAHELHHKAIPDSARSLSIGEFAADPRYGVRRVIDFYNRWREEAPALKSSLFLRYEDLHRDPTGQMRRLLDYLSLDFDEEQIARAVDFASFGSLQQLERDGFFRSGRLGAADPSNPDSFKVRRGEIGGYRSHFSAEEVAAFDRMVGTLLHGDFGYGAAGVSAEAALVGDRQPGIASRRPPATSPAR
jgi:hypothetical protein